MKIKVKENDPGFDGTLADSQNIAEKMGLLTDAKRWLRTRELRNIQDHDYTEDELEIFLTSIANVANFVLDELKDFKP